MAQLPEVARWERDGDEWVLHLRGGGTMRLTRDDLSHSVVQSMYQSILADAVGRFTGGEIDDRDRQASAQIRGGSDKKAGRGSGGAASVAIGTLSKRDLADVTHYTIAARADAAAGASMSMAARGLPCHEDVRSDGVLPGEVLAYRAWRVFGCELHSVGVSAVWQPGEVMRGNVRQVGVWGKMQGVYALKTETLAVREAESGAGPFRAKAWGSVHLWGEIVEHVLGYRAECGAVHRVLGVIPHDDALLESLRMRYDEEDAQ